MLLVANKSVWVIIHTSVSYSTTRTAVHMLFKKFFESVTVATKTPAGTNVRIFIHTCTCIYVCPCRYVRVRTYIGIYIHVYTLNRMLSCCGYVL